MHTAFLRMPATAAILCSTTLGFDDSGETLRKVRDRMRADLARIPNVVCAQDVERFRRGAPEKPWGKLDTLRLEVASVGDQELYALSGDGRFSSKPLAQLVGRGTVGTGQFANFVRQVFGGDGVEFEFKGETEQDGAPALEFAFDIEAARSAYKLSASGAESVVAFQGRFWVSKADLDLIRLEVQAYDIPPNLGIAEAETAVSYTRAEIGGESLLLPRSAMLTITATDGVADMNRSHLSSCRRYRSESVVKYEAETTGESDRSTAVAPDRRSVAGLTLQDRSIFELALESALEPSSTAVGDPIWARLTGPIKDGASVIVPQGARVSGRVVRIERQTLPFPAYEVGLEFSSAEVGGRPIPISASMIHAGPADGLVRQARRLEPTFTRKREPRMNILVR